MTDEEEKRDSILKKMLETTPTPRKKQEKQERDENKGKDSGDKC